MIPAAVVLAMPVALEGLGYNHPPIRKLVNFTDALQNYDVSSDVTQRMSLKILLFAAFE